MACAMISGSPKRGVGGPEYAIRRETPVSKSESANLGPGEGWVARTQRTPSEGGWQDAKAAPRLGITGLGSAPQELSRLAEGNERSELGLDGDEACGTSGAVPGPSREKRHLQLL